MDRKRHLSSSDSNDESPDGCPSKKPCVELLQASLLTLPDDMLLLIFSYLETLDYLNLMKTCQRLSNVATDSSLWKRVDTSNGFLSNQDFRMFTPLLSKRTKVIVIDGADQTCSIKDYFFNHVSECCTDLSVFALKSCFVDTSKTSIINLPPSVQHFGVTNCRLTKVQPQPSVFLGMSTKLPNLTTLDLTGSRWMPHHSLQAIAKCPKLEKLCLAGCWHIGDTAAYTAIAVGGGGFKSLKWLDLRGTGVGTHELAYFASLSSIECLYVGRLTADPIILPNGGEGDGVVENSFFNLFRSSNRENKFKELGLSYTAITESVLKLFLALPLVKLYFHARMPLPPDAEFTGSRILCQDPIPSLKLGSSL